MSARQVMRHRCRIERDHTAPAAAPSWQTHLDNQPCRVWNQATRDQQAATVENLRVLVPKGTDVTALDRIAYVNDRRGQQVLAGPLGIQALVQHPDHLALFVRATPGLAQHNAHLLKIESPGLPADYDQAAGAPTVKWQGDVRAFLTDRVEEQISGQSELNVPATTVIEIPAGALDIEVAVEDLVTFQFEVDGGTHRRRVRQLERGDDTGVLRIALWTRDL